MTNENTEIQVEFTEEGRRELIKAIWPEMTEEEGIQQLSTFIKYIILK